MNSPQEPQQQPAMEMASMSAPGVVTQQPLPEVDYQSPITTPQSQIIEPAPEPANNSEGSDTYSVDNGPGLKARVYELQPPPHLQSQICSEPSLQSHEEEHRDDGEQPLVVDGTIAAFHNHQSVLVGTNSNPVLEGGESSLDPTPNPILQDSESSLEQIPRARTVERFYEEGRPIGQLVTRLSQLDSFFNSEDTLDDPRSPAFSFAPSLMMIGDHHRTNEPVAASSSSVVLNREQLTNLPVTTALGTAVLYDEENRNPPVAARSISVLSPGQLANLSVANSLEAVMLNDEQYTNRQVADGSDSLSSGAGFFGLSADLRGVTWSDQEIAYIRTAFGVSQIASDGRSPVMIGVSDWDPWAEDSEGTQFTPADDSPHLNGGDPTPAYGPPHLNGGGLTPAYSPPHLNGGQSSTLAGGPPHLNGGHYSRLAGGSPHLNGGESSIPAHGPPHLNGGESSTPDPL
ncbi:hypothetical protein NUW58_g3516 [Xylaria curta]|uniref:Uncharacterized protein n=1 Tax=Xylaria curta TaxID=42375 RepID=A0ACC1PC85_9PEZI|nr:hypothetical protein NUW58_g3516 [Xylaria curta]